MTRTVRLFRIPSLALGAFVIAAGSAFAGAGAPPTTIGGEEEAAAPPIDMAADWPCVQHKVPVLSVSAIWDGPPIDDVKGWFREEGVPNLIEVLASRRVPLDEAEAAIEAFAKAQPEDKRDEKMLLLFAGLFDKVSGQRRSVMSGIEKYQKSQKERARELERQSTELGKLEAKAAADASAEKERDAFFEKYTWTQRIFQERQANIPLACELPVLIEERLFALTRAIRSQMSS